MLLKACIPLERHSSKNVYFVTSRVIRIHEPVFFENFTTFKEHSFLDIQSMVVYLTSKLFH